MGMHNACRPLAIGRLVLFTHNHSEITYSPQKAEKLLQSRGGKEKREREREREKGEQIRLGPHSEFRQTCRRRADGAKDQVGHTAGRSSCRPSIRLWFFLNSFCVGAHFPLVSILAWPCPAWLAGWLARRSGSGPKRKASAGNDPSIHLALPPPFLSRATGNTRLTDLSAKKEEKKQASPPPSPTRTLAWSRSRGHLVETLLVRPPSRCLCISSFWAVLFRHVWLACVRRADERADGRTAGVTG